MRLREDVIERLYAYYRWAKMLDEDPPPAGLVRFHTTRRANEGERHDTSSL
jgi:hypothetical protein